MFNVSIWSLENFGGQMSKNIQDVRKIALKMLKCVLMGPSLFGQSSSIFCWLNLMWEV